MGQSTRFGSLLKHHRLAAGLTQEELASAAGLSARAISALERGVNRTPHRDTLQLLLKALDLSPHDRTALEAAARTKAAPPFLSFSVNAEFPSLRGGPLHRVPASPSPLQFVGREEQLALVERHLQAGDPPVLLVSGEPGIGKTRLLEEAALRATACGLCVLSAGCNRRSGQEPYTPLLPALDRCIASLSASQLHASLEGCGWLALFLPELEETGVMAKPQVTLTAGQERRLMFRAVARFLANISRVQGQRGTVLLLDDLQWASPDALDLLMCLAESAVQIPLRIIAAYRSTELPLRGPLSEALADLTRLGLASSVELGPLTPAESATLLAELLPEPADHQQVRSLLQRSGGVPFFLVSCAHETNEAAAQGGSESGGAVPGIPRDVAHSIRQRVSVLPDDARELLEAAAVVGRRVPVPVMCTLGAQLGRSRSGVQLALDAACQAKLLVSLEDGSDAYQFAHDLIREAIEADIGPGRRAVLHLWAAQALEQGADVAPPVLLAYHYLRAGEWDKAIFYLERAGDRALALHAHADALRAYRDLAASLDRLGRSTQAAQAREKVGAALTTMALYDEALDVLSGVVSSYRANDDLEGLVRVMARVGEVHVLHGTSAEGVTCLHALLASLDERRVPPRDLAALYTAQAWLINATGHYRDALATAERAATLAASAADAALQVKANLRRSQLLLMLGHLDEGARTLQELIPLATTLGDLRSLRLALNSLGWVHEAWGQFEQDKEYTERALLVAEQLDDPTVLAFMRSNHGSPAFNLGDWKQARNDFELGVAMIHELGVSWASAWPPLLLGHLCLVEGQHEIASHYLSEAIAHAERNHDLQALRWAHAVLAERDLVNGVPQSARERLEPLLDRPGQEESDVCPLLSLLAWSYCDLGQDYGQVEALLAEAIARASSARMLPALVTAWRVQALLSQRRHRWTRAQQDLERALTMSRSMHHPYGEAKCLYGLGQLFIQQREVPTARRHLESSLAVLARLGERLYAAAAEKLLEAAVVPSQASR